ncbi:MAG: efflux RND transporter periplasmic adaptor subunit [Bacteroidales bacterium]|nr:efflux RND transporter periplasmic adaptor subunit [Bacteroidales bacterium]
MKRKIIIVSVIILVCVAGLMKLYVNKKQIDADSAPRISKVSVPVFVETVKESKLDNSFSVNGTFDPAREIAIISQTQGKIVSLNFNNGDFVKEGQILASCDLELLEAQKDLANANLDKCTNDLKKFREMLQTKAATQQQIDELQLALYNAQASYVTVTKQIEYSIIKAPFSGYITGKHIEKGSMIMPGTPVAEMMDISTMKFNAGIAESDLVKISKNQEVKVVADIYEGFTYAGKIKNIGMKADDSRRFPVEIEVRNNVSKPIRSGMFGMAYFTSEGTHNAISIPRTALVGSIKDPAVYIVENDKARKKPIKVGSASEKSIEVIEGLKAGDKVVISGQINLDDNTPVAISNEKAQ